MSTEQVSFDGVVYPFAPLEPENHSRPTPMYPVAITPDIARHWLAFNYINRNKRESGQQDYATDMRNGDFVLNGSSITFTRPYEEGEHGDVPAGHVTLLDGQHRLLSCIRALKAFTAYVGYGFNPRVRSTVDTGIKRKLSDALALRGEKDTNVLSAVISRCYAWSDGDQRLGMKKGGVTYSVQLEFFEEHPEIRRSAEIAAITRKDFKFSKDTDLRQSTAGWAHWMLMQQDPGYTPEFFARLGDGDQLRTCDPIEALRRRFTRDQKVKRQPEGASRREIMFVPDWQHVCYYIRTFNARRLWDQLPKEMQENFRFALIGRSDGETTPGVWDDEEVLRRAEVYIRRVEGGGSVESDA